MAFRKRKKIAKGLHLNLSGSGIGLGFRLLPGLSFSLNNSGVYCNTSIPGSGFYSRNKISNTRPRQNNVPSRSSSCQAVEPSATEVEIHIHAENDGTYTTRIYDSEGNENTDPLLKMRVLSNPKYKETVVRAINDCTNELVDMYKLTAKPLTEADMKKKVEEAKPKKVRKKAYLVEKPSYEALKAKLESEAQEKINSIFFWTNKSKREKYVQERLDIQYKPLIDEWEKNKRKHNEQQIEYVEEETSRMQKEYEDANLALQGFTTGDEIYVNESIEQLLACLKVPFEFAINFEYLQEYKLLRIQLDLPEIEDFPKKKAKLLATEEISIKDKGKAEYLNDYAKSVTGMAFFFAGMFFNVSLRIEYIEISAYTQRISKVSGNEEDCYIYSVLFNRYSFSQINYQAIDPIEALKAQPNKSKILKSNELKEITPFTEEEIVKLIKKSDNLSIADTNVIVDDCQKETKMLHNTYYEDFSIAGINFRHGIDKYIGDFEGRLIPEPDNEYDPNAIRIEHSDGHHLGYISSNQTEYLRGLVKNMFPVSCTGHISENVKSEENRKYYQGVIYVEIPTI